MGIALVLYVLVLFYFMFFSERYGRLNASADYRYNLHLFAEIRRYIVYRTEVGPEYFIVNIFGNVLAFAPFGFFLSIAKPKLARVYAIIVMSFLLSLTIETLQLLLKVGIFDVDDLFMNTVGGLLGYGIYRMTRKVLKV